MNTNEKNLFIVDSDDQMVIGLKNYLDKRFENSLNISTFNTSKSCLENIDKNTSFVILTYFFEGQNGNEILKSIKAINPQTKVILLSSNEEIGIALESFSNVDNDCVERGHVAWNKMASDIFRLIL